MMFLGTRILHGNVPNPAIFFTREECNGHTEVEHAQSGVTTSIDTRFWVIRKLVVRFCTLRSLPLCTLRYVTFCTCRSQRKMADNLDNGPLNV